MLKQDIFLQVARIHITRIDKGFLGTLGENFLALMYRAIDECETSVLLIEEQQGRVVGFVTGAVGIWPIYKQMLKNFKGLFLALCPVLLRPCKVWRIIEILRHGGSKEKHLGLPRNELLSIAILCDYEGKGIAQRLYARLVKYFREEGALGFRIVVGKDLKSANSFYMRMGAKPVNEIFLHAKEKSIVYVHYL